MNLGKLKRILLSLLILFLVNSIFPEIGVSGEGKMSLERIGSRILRIHGDSYVFPWYKIRADYNSIDQPEFWQRVECPQGTKKAYVGHYGAIKWCEWQEEGSHDQIQAPGISFILPEKFRVNPGEGKVHLRRWLFEEKSTEGDTVFREGRYYVFCLKREPVERWKNLALEPSCDLDGELGNLLAVIEIFPTFDLDSSNASKVLNITQDNLISFRSERADCSPSGYFQEFAIFRSPDGTCQYENRNGKRVQGNPELMQKALYAVNSCSWKKLEKHYQFNVLPAVTRSIIEFWEFPQKQAQSMTSGLNLPKTGNNAGKTGIATFCYDMGAWIYLDKEGNSFRTFFPKLLFEVKKEIEALK